MYKKCLIVINCLCNLGYGKFHFIVLGLDERIMKFFG